MLKEFREFALKGNVVDLAVGLILGAAFGKIVTSLVSDIVMPPLGLLVGGVDFSSLFINLSHEHYASLAEAKKAGAATINYGLFINQVIDFLIVAVAVFLMVKQLNALKRRFAGQAPPAATEKRCQYCLMNIPIGATRCAHCTSQLEAA